MKDTLYAYAVSSVRAKELSLLTPAFMQQMLDAPDEPAALALLADKGLRRADGQDYMRAAWDFLNEISPDINALDFLIVRNDFHNLKASLKALLAGAEPQSLFISPCITDPAVMFEAVKARKKGEIPEFLEKAAVEGYELLTSSMDGQMLDIYLDRAALEAQLNMAERTKSEMCVRYAQVFTALTDIKIALRMARLKRESVKDALCPCRAIDITAVAAAAQKGADEVLSYLNGTEFSGIADAFGVSAAAFERAFDDYLLAIFDGARLISFGIEPLAAYYCAREAEQKTLRIILECKAVGLSAESIKERVRRLYV